MTRRSGASAYFLPLRATGRQHRCSGGTQGGKSTGLSQNVSSSVSLLLRLVRLQVSDFPVALPELLLLPVLLLLLLLLTSRYPASRPRTM